MTKKQFNQKVKDLGFWNESSHYIYNLFKPSYFSFKKEEKLKEKKIRESRGYYIIVESITGMEGGNCWNDDEPRPFSYDPDEWSDPIIKILEEVCPDISLIKYKKLTESINKKDFDHHEKEYYGNSTTYRGFYYDWCDVYNCLIDAGIFSAPEQHRHAVIIGGLPCSGKTTLAKEEYGDFFLIDDPVNKEEITNNFDKDKIVITHPQLSFKKDRGELKQILKAENYEIEEVVLKVNKNTLKSRAKKRTGEKSKVLDFIQQNQVE